MPKEKVTLTIDTVRLEELRRLVGARSMSSAVEVALEEYLAKVRHLAAVDDWLAEMEHEDGPIPQDKLDWAAQVFREWEAERTAPKQKAGSRRRRRAG